MLGNLRCSAGLTTSRRPDSRPGLTFGDSTSRRATQAYHWVISRIPPEYLGPETLDRSVAADVLVREEPDEEEEDEQENEQDKDKEEDDDDGYSE